MAQRDLHRFREVPRLMYTNQSSDEPAVAISKTLFAGRSVLLVLSDGDGRGGLGMQLVDPSKGQGTQGATKMDKSQVVFIIFSNFSCAWNL